MENTLINETYATTSNGMTLPLFKIPVLPYDSFSETVLELLSAEVNHCVNYYAYRTTSGDLKFICVIANDESHQLFILSHVVAQGDDQVLSSLARKCFPLYIFEREITENFGIEFENHPWAKPVRYAFNRADQGKVINNYPFYKIDSEELHEVGVGPIHAGVIEPGHFRFLCNGETVLHLEIQLGWQHRGIENLFLTKTSLLQRTILAESIAGDTSLGHSLAFVNMMESMDAIKVSARLELERTLALELERIAMHVGDLGNVNIGFAYQLASSVFGTLRTPVINYAQTWCGNRFGKGLNRVGGSHYPFSPELSDKLMKLLNDFEERFNPMADRLFQLPSALVRAENIGKVTKKQMELIGAVGMAARNAGLLRDVRVSHPFSGFRKYPIDTQVLEQGDVWARLMLRKQEIKISLDYIRDLMEMIAESKEVISKPISQSELTLAPDSLCVSLVEGWRGEICHCGITDSEGNIFHYKVKDPSFHNWMALALSLRDLEISDFPINNKSYNLSYCGHDL